MVCPAVIHTGVEGDTLLFAEAPPIRWTLLEEEGTQAPGGAEQEVATDDPWGRAQSILPPAPGLTPPYLQYSEGAVITLSVPPGTSLPNILVIPDLGIDGTLVALPTLYLQACVHLHTCAHLGATCL